MANAGGACGTNAKKIVGVVELKQKRHAAARCHRRWGTPPNRRALLSITWSPSTPVIKFTTLFGLLAVELAVQLTASQGEGLTHILAAVFFAISFVFVYRSFYSMRIRATDH